MRPVKPHLFPTLRYNTSLLQLKVKLKSDYSARIRKSKSYRNSRCSSPRSWERVDASLKTAGMSPTKTCGQNTPIGFYAMVLGFVGAEAAITFQDFVKNYDLQISAEDVIDRYKEFSEKISSLSNDKVNSLIDKVSEHCKNSEWTVPQCKRVSVFAKTLPGEMLVSLWNNVMDSGNVNNITRLHKYLGQAVLEAVTVARNLQ